MNRAAEDRAASAQAAEVTRRVRRRLTASIDKLRGVTLTPEMLDMVDPERAETFDALLKRFEQLYDYAAKQLLRLGLLASAENLAGMSARDAFDRAEALGAKTPAARSMEFAAIRNLLAHAHPLDPEVRAASVNGAPEAAPDLVAAVDDLLDLWRRRGLLEGETP